MDDTAYVELRNLRKTFGSVIANNNVNLSLKKGEIHALLGENGSGKTTLMNMLSGVYAPESGDILIDGKKKEFHSPGDAIGSGVGMVHQHFKLIDVLTAKENVIAGQKSSFFVRQKELSKEINAIADKYGLKINPDQKVYNMSVSEKQTVEILKMLYRGATVLILDEPTAVLTPQEIRVLFDILRNMKRENCAIVIITHKMNEVMEISDKVTVLRKGECIKTLNTAETNVRELTELMVGRTISLSIERTPVNREAQKQILDVKGLTVKNIEGINMLDGVSFTMSSGEILGVAGIAGSGQKELCDAITGLEHIHSGEINFVGGNIAGMSPIEIMHKGIMMNFVPEDRLSMGLVGGMDIINNVLLKYYQDTPGVFIDRALGKQKAQEIIEQYDVSTPSCYHQVKKLSGGNIQKVLLGREISRKPQLLITAYPVRGLDIGATLNIYDILDKQKQEGVGILFVGEDLDALLEVSDRIMVLNHGKVIGIVDAASVTKEDVGLMMLGHVAEPQNTKLEVARDEN